MIKSICDGSSSAWSSAWRTTAGTRSLVCCLVDDAAGIEPRVLQHLFDRLDQVPFLHTGVLDQTEDETELRMVAVQPLCQFECFVLGDDVLGNCDCRFAEYRHGSPPSGRWSTRPSPERSGTSAGRRPPLRRGTRDCAKRVVGGCGAAIRCHWWARTGRPTKRPSSHRMDRGFSATPWLALASRYGRPISVAFRAERAVGTARSFRGLLPSRG